jgi:DNA-binding TFAR19-related protein (PDSD5 family)
MEDELERLRHKKMAEMMKRIGQQKKEQELKQEETEKEDQFLLNFMLPEAYRYYKDQILPNRPMIAQKIVEVLNYLVSSGVLQYKLNTEQVILIDRKLSGVGPSIKIKRSGKEYMDIATALKKEK